MKHSKRTPVVICPTCHGQGSIYLDGVLLDTLRTVLRMKRASAPEVHRAMDTTGAFHVTAFNNRLDDLVAMGLLEKSKNGRCWIYSPISK